MPIRGKDGAYYDNVDEVMKANARWEQQEKQNKLLKEQNNLIKQQQEIEQRNKYEEQRQEFEEQMQKQKRQFESQLQKIHEQGQKNFERIFIEEISPLMLEAGIKDPVAYYKKLLELYGDKPTEEELKLLTDDVDIKEAVNYPLEIGEKIKKLPPAVKKMTRKSQIKFSLGEAVFLGGIGLFCSEFNILFAVIFGAVGFIVGMLTMLLVNATTKTNLKRNEKRKEKINSINAEIEEYNQKIRKESEEWENKIKNFEKRRMEKFNYSLEIALDRLSVTQLLLAKDKYDMEYYQKLNYTLKFNKYPEDWEKKKQEYYDAKNKEKAINDGTEMFLNL